MKLQTFTAQIYIAGNIGTAREVLRSACFHVGLCVTLAPCEYIYSGGLESGVVVGLVNYPRFPSKPAKIAAQARRLAGVLMERLCQRSALVVTTTETEWLQNPQWKEKH